MTVEFDEVLAEKLKTICNDLLKKARRKRKMDFGAVNWADLKVIDVIGEFRLFFPHGPLSYNVYVDEAAPDCKLGSWMGEELIKLGYKNVYVTTEW